MPGLLLLIIIFVYIFLGEEKVTEIHRKRHSAPDVSFKGRVRKVAKLVEVSDDDSDDYSPCKFVGNYLIFVSGANHVANLYCLLQLQIVLISLIYIVHTNVKC